MDRRPGHPQLGQPRGRRRARHPARPLPVAGPRVRRRRRLHLHRRGGPGPHVEWKLKAAKAIHDIAVDRYGLEPGDLFFDPLALTLGTGMEESRGDGVATLEGIRLIKEHLPGVHTTLGLSNISFGLNPAARHVLNSVFLHEAAQAGLDSAIVHAARIMPLARIPEEQKQVCLDLIYDRRTDDYDPLQELLVDVRGRQRRDGREGGPLRLDRSSSASPPASSTATATASPPTSTSPSTAGHTPLAIINDILLEGMKVVGDLFGTGEMQLPFVLQSAETMKAAVAYLEPMMDKVDGESTKGRIVLATVKGDVHDIGKNLVDIILTNNGYEVHNLGIKVNVAEMIDKAVEVKADAIGMSGLLVKSTLIMRENLEELNTRGLAEIPVLLGGAALTRVYVERDLREVYEGRLFYGKDAFEGLHVMDRIGATKRGDTADDPDWGRVPIDSTIELKGRFAKPGAEDDAPVDLPARSPEVETDNEVFVPPFLGSRGREGHLARRHRRLHQRDGALPQPVAVPAREGRERRRLQGPHPADAPRGAGQGQGRRPARAAARLRLLPGQRRRRRPRHLDRRDPHRRSGPASTTRASARTSSSASPTSSGPPTAARSTTPPSTSSRWARP